MRASHILLSFNIKENIKYNRDCFQKHLVAFNIGLILKSSDIFSSGR